jgi:hypothetical protein
MQDDQECQASEKLDALPLEGLNSGDPLPADAEFWSHLKNEALAMPDGPATDFTN